jgi:acyl-CoA synthetase (AMP-forming)/AMP-acid ligase II
MRSASIADMLARRRGGSPLLRAGGRPPLTTDACCDLLESTVDALRARGIGPETRVAAVLPNGPELAASFITIASAAAFAPLNPNYPREELRFFLGDLRPAALVTQPGFCPAAEQASAELGIPVVGLRPNLAGPAGRFSLEGPAVGPPRSRSERASHDSVALLLHSSGTTARPKLIPLTHANLTASAGNIARTLELGDQDICLGIMPMFHIHGLVGGLLSSLSAGASVFCTQGFNVFRFASWMAESQATWCTAVPTMYQTILTRDGSSQGDASTRLRFLRSSSAPLHVQVSDQLERVFGCPVVNSFGMTEASHQMASNPLPPRVRKPGTVGPAAGPEIAIMSEEGTLVAPFARGEVVIRGDTVTAGYLSPEQANAMAFLHGWFRTGDEGFLDADGYLTLVGRLKEMINVGGEKVAPAEVDEVLMQHPAVRQALAFGAPCPRRGEKVCAVVVLQAETDSRTLRDFARARLAKFKVPETLLIVNEIPTGPTGKLQRIGLAARLGIE